MWYNHLVIENGGYADRLKGVEEAQELQDNLDTDFRKMTGELITDILDTGALVAARKLIEEYPDINWSTIPSTEELTDRISKGKAATQEVIERAIENRAAAQLASHEASLQLDKLTESVEAALRNEAL